MLYNEILVQKKLKTSLTGKAHFSSSELVVHVNKCDSTSSQPVTWICPQPTSIDQRIWI